MTNCRDSARNMLHFHVQNLGRVRLGAPRKLIGGGVLPHRLTCRGRFRLQNLSFGIFAMTLRSGFRGSGRVEGFRHPSPGAA